MARCEECGFDWDAPLLTQIRTIGQLPDKVADALAGAGGAAYRRPAPATWSPNEYAWHLVDMLSIFAEWLYMTRTLDHPTHAAADVDRLAEARRYAELPVETALWSLRPAAALLVEEAVLADSERLVMYKDWRDVTAAEVIGFAAHEAVHHLFDLQRGLSANTAPESQP